MRWHIDAGEPRGCWPVLSFVIRRKALYRLSAYAAAGTAFQPSLLSSPLALRHFAVIPRAAYTGHPVYTQRGSPRALKARNSLT